MFKTIILIPSRLAAKRLPNKPLFKVKGKALINHVYDKAVKTKLGEVYVATCDDKIIKEVTKSGGQCIITNKRHKTGTDRIFEGFNKLKKNKSTIILNLQGDEPLINIRDIRRLTKTFSHKKMDMATLASKIFDKSDLINKNVVKVITKSRLTLNNFSDANDFFRKKINVLSRNIYHHIGVYIYNYKTLKKIVSLKRTKREKLLSLEQIRALDNNIKINVMLVKNKPIGVDTLKDFYKVKKLLK